jgi:hypothetical protein
VPLILIPLAVLIVLAPIALTPLSLVMRYRRGTARRQARGWVATVNVVAIAISATLLLVTAAVMGLWVPRAFVSALGGLAAGGLLGLVGLRASRWEPSPDALHFTPNRWLVLGIIVAVACRVLYSLWRAWHALQGRPHDTSWLAASGAAGSLAVGALVLGYYLMYWWGVRRRWRRHARR